MRKVTILLWLLLSNLLHANTGAIEGIIYETNTKEPIPFASIALKKSKKGTNSDINGKFKLEGLDPGFYQLTISCVGYEAYELQNIQVQTGRTQAIDIFLKPDIASLESVVVTVEGLSKQKEALATVHTLSSNAIQYSAGGASDIMQTIQTLPGISTPVGFSSELRIRGGASMENSFYVDGIPIPLINHFGTQGSSNGIRSILNSAMLKNAKVYTSSFPLAANSGISGVFDFSFKNGNREQAKTKIVLSSTDAAFNRDGPLGKKVTYNVSYRKSYLKPTLRILDRPKLANYSDWGYKIQCELGENSTLSFIGVGNVDENALNQTASTTLLNQYFLSNSNSGTIHHFTNGVQFKHFRKKGHTVVQFSQADLKYHIYREKLEELVKKQPAFFYDYTSADQSRQLLLTHIQEWSRLHWEVGSNLKHQYFNTRTSYKWERLATKDKSELSYRQWEIFTKVSHQFNASFLWSLGMKMQGNNLNEQLQEPFAHFAPNFSFSWQLYQHLTLKGNTGLYFQLPPNLTLAHTNDRKGVNNQKTADYFSVKHNSLGLHLELPNKHSKLSIEVFHKQYKNYPLSVASQTILPNKSDGLLGFGNEWVDYTKSGKAYGLEFLYQKDLWNDSYGKFSYTLQKSAFLNERTNRYRPTIMDARHVLNLTFGKHLKKGWHLGMNGRLQSGLPYTPFDLNQSARIVTWQPINLGVKDYTKVNQIRQKVSFGLDLRVDKVYELKQERQLKWYMDLADVVQSKVNGAPFLYFPKDAANAPMVNPNTPENYQFILVDNELATFLPTVGVEWLF